MSKSSDLSSKVKITFEVDAKQFKAAMIESTDGLKSFKFNMQGVNIETTNIKEATSGYGTSVRGILLNLRMFSFALRTVRREMGIQNPIIEKWSTTLITVSAILTGIVSIVGLASQAIGAFMGATTGLIGTLKVAIGVLGGLNVWLLAIAAIAATIWAVGEIQAYRLGIKDLRTEIKGLEADMSMLSRTVELLNIEQERFNLGMSATSITIQRLKRAIDLQQSGTEALEAQLEAVNAEYQNMQINAAEMSLAIGQQTLAEKDLLEMLADKERRIKAIRIAQRSAIPEDVAFRALQMVGWREGDPRPPKGVFEAAGYQYPERRPPVFPGGIGGAAATININIGTIQGAYEEVRSAILGALRQGLGNVQHNQYNDPGNQR